MWIVLAALAAAVPATPAPGVCSALAADYDDASKDLAEGDMSGLGDQSVYRSIDRKLDGVMTMERAHMALDLMRDHHCPMPTTTPSEVRYMLPALSCKNDRMKATGTESPRSCNHETWMPAVK